MPGPSTFSALTISEVMHPGVIDCPPQTPLREVASLMAENTVHCVVVDGLARGPQHTERLVWGVISDVDFMRAAGSGDMESEAGEIAAPEIVTINPTDNIQQAAKLMGEHECSHLIVVEPDSGRPLGIVSSLDVARALVWGPRPSSSVPAT